MKPNTLHPRGVTHLPLILGAALLITTSPQIQASSVRVVTGSAANIRSNPSMGGTVLAKLYQGTQVNPLAQTLAWQSSNWTRISLPETARVWVSRNYVNQGKVTASNLHVRSGPGSWADSVGLIPQGTKVKPLERFGNWLRIKVPNGLSAYVSTSLLSGTGGATMAKLPSRVPKVGVQAKPSQAPARNDRVARVNRKRQEGIAAKKARKEAKPNLVSTLEVEASDVKTAPQKFINTLSTPASTATGAAVTKVIKGATATDAESATEKVEEAKPKKSNWFKRLLGID